MTRRTRLFALAPSAAPTPGPEPADGPLVMDSCIAAVDSHALPGLPQEWQDVIAVVRQPRAVAEVAARLKLPVSTALAVATELHRLQLINHQPPMTEEQTHDPSLLRRIVELLREA